MQYNGSGTEQARSSGSASAHTSAAPAAVPAPMSSVGVPLITSSSQALQLQQREQHAVGQEFHQLGPQQQQFQQLQQRHEVVMANVRHNNLASLYIVE